MPAALRVIDVQRAFDDAGHRGRRNNPGCEANVAALLAAWKGLHGDLATVRTRHAVQRS